MTPRPGYRTQAQKDRRGGKTRTQQVREKITQHKRRLRENNLADPKIHTTPISKHVNNRGTSENDYAVYGIYKDGSEWVLTGLAATDDYETMSKDRSKRSTIKVRGRYVLTGRTSGTIDPKAGLELSRFDTKRDAMQYVSADATEKVTAGAYLVRPKHDPRPQREEVDKDAFTAFRERAIKVWE